MVLGQIPELVINGAMIIGVGGVLNLAHGALIMFGAYAFAMLSRSTSLGLHAAIAFPIAVVAIAVLSLLLYEVLVRWVEENPVITFLATVIVAVIATEAVLAVFGNNNTGMTLVTWGSLNLNDLGISTRVRWVRILGFVVSWIAIGLLWFYVNRTDDGRSILAASMSERGAILTAVNLHMVRAKTWLIAGALAGIAGVFLGAADGATPQMWLSPLALAFIIVVIGGIGSIKGSVVAAYIIGFLEQFTVTFIGHQFRGILSLVLLLLFILYMPQGLYGREFVHE